jgi:hypothetical protein
MITFNQNGPHCGGQSEMTDKQLLEFSDAFSWDHPNATPSTVRESDDGFDFPPAAHPGRELATASLFGLAIMTLVVWGGWKLISLILVSLISP